MFEHDPLLLATAQPTRESRCRPPVNEPNGGGGGLAGGAAGAGRRRRYWWPPRMSTAHSLLQAVVLLSRAWHGIGGTDGRCVMHQLVELQTVTEAKKNCPWTITKDAFSFCGVWLRAIVRSHTSY
jgi:hypothetical protein